MMSKRMARVRITTDLILQALHFPAGARVLACYGERAAYPGDIELVVEHDELPEVAEGGEAPLMKPVITIYYEGDAIPANGRVHLAPLVIIGFEWGE
jgi:hypothetical protein